MDGPAKRHLKDEDVEPALHPSTPVDYSLQLRNVGARVRRSVAQGYISPPSQSSFTKYQSTGTIFRSERDTLRDVFANSPPAVSDALLFQNKRNRSMVDAVETNAEVGTPTHHSYSGSMDLEGIQFNPRPIKPLKNSRKTKSDSVLTFSDREPRPQVEEMAPALEADEEDWSLMDTDKPTPFTPFSL